jgi:DNA polymerase
MRPNSFDAETSAFVPIQLGADRYTADPRTRCLMFAWHEVGSSEKPRLWREGDPVPYAIKGHVANGGSFAGWNVIGFDRLVYSRILVAKHGFPPIDDDCWRDSMHLAAAANLPRSLDGCARAVGVAHDASLKDQNRLRRITDANRTAIPAPVAEILDYADEREGFLRAWVRENLGKPINGSMSSGDLYAWISHRTEWRYDAKLVDDLRWLADRCVQDVSMEEGVLLRLPPWPVMQPWLAMPSIDRRINDRGVMIDLPLVKGLARAAAIETARLDVEIAKLTDGEVPKTTNVESLKAWLVGRGVELPSTAKEVVEDDGDELDEEDDAAEAAVVRKTGRKSPWFLRKSDIADLLARTDVPESCRMALMARAEAAKASTGKLRAMIAMADDHWRLRGILLMGGAQQTMRWSSVKVQLHNTLRDVFANHDDIADTNGLNAKTDAVEVKRLADTALATAIEVGRTGDSDLMRCMYETMRRDAQGRSYRSGVISWVSRMVRRTICAPAGSLLLNGDWAQVEARITVWLSQQLDMLSAFASGDDVYRIAAAGIFGLPPEQITKFMRQTGKVSILALGFGGAEGALVAMAQNYGILMNRIEAAPIVKAWREANAQTRKYWYATDDAAAWAVQYPGREFAVPPLGLVSYSMQGDCLCCRLPSGRLLRYWQPRLTQEYWGNGRPKDRLSLSALAIKGRAVFRRSVYHTILVENQVQAIAADLLAEALLNADAAGIPIGLHVHDNLAGEVLETDVMRKLSLFERCMLDMRPWTSGLPIAVEAEANARFG